MPTVNLSQQMKEILENYTDEVVDAIRDVLEDVSEEAADELKSSSPKRTGKYARSWSSDNEMKRTYMSAVVHNKRHYQLTHLLENGHARRGGGRNVPAVEHIGTVNEHAQEKAVKKIEEAIKKIK